MKTASLVVALLFITGTTRVHPDSSNPPGPITFKCTTAEGQPAADLVVDVENRILTWGGQHYLIHATDDRYISAYEQGHGEVGGEVWVFNRITGEYLRASVYIGYSSAEAIRNNESGKLTAATFRGKCSRPLL